MRKKDIEIVEYYLNMLKTVETEEEHNNSMNGLFEYMEDWRADYLKRKENKKFDFIIKRED